jgi:hypothetical protein
MELLEPEVALGALPVVGAYVLTMGPPPVAGMPCPRPRTDWDAIAEAGFGVVISLDRDRTAYDPSPLKLVRFDLEDLAHGGVPEDPEREEGLICAAASSARSWLNRGVGAVVHCAGGRGRTGTVLGAIAVQAGIAPQVAAEWLDVVHKLRGRPGWPESPWQRHVLGEFQMLDG